MLHNKTTRLAVLFVLVGAMMIFLVSMVTEQVYARTVGFARAYRIEHFFCCDPIFTNVKGHLDAGKWIIAPKVVWGGHAIEWVTAGSGLFGGNEKGSVVADFGPGRHVTFSWNNPDQGHNSCKIQWNGHLFTAPCSITQDTLADAKYIVSTQPITCSPCH